MSNSIGAVRFLSDNTIKYFEYYGTPDVCEAILRDTEDEVNDNWRSHNQDERCNCTPEPVEIFSTYGDGFYWKGTACKEHGFIFDGITPDYDSQVDGHPDWSPWKNEPR